LSPTKSLTFVLVFTIISLLFFAPSFTYYSSATQDTPTEDVDAEDIWALFQSTNEHVNQTADAIESGNSTVALELLAQIRTDLNNISGNVTDLIFSASQAPP
jgi:predicted PurR-regulated permease PerM